MAESVLGGDGFLLPGGDGFLLLGGDGFLLPGGDGFLLLGGELKAPLFPGPGIRMHNSREEVP